MPDLIRAVLRRERESRGWSRSTLSRRTVRPGYEGVPESTIEALETKHGRVPDLDILQALATALEIPPGTFYEYPIALARAGVRITAPDAAEVAAAAEPVLQAARHTPEAPKRAAQNRRPRQSPGQAQQ